MKFRPVLTEKSMGLAKKGFYSFFVDKGLTKPEIKKLINHSFDVHVKGIKSLNYKGLSKRNYKGTVQTVKPIKKVIVSLAKDEKIDLFEEKAK
jgi:large subunit ribosomal protein L23